MNPEQASRNLEMIRSLMERTCQYQLLTARAGLAAGSLACAGALIFPLAGLDAAHPGHFAAVWGLVFAGSFLATSVGSVVRGRQRGEKVWSRPGRAILMALAPSLFAAAALTLFFFARGEHLWLPGAWMLCYGQGALATSAYAPRQITWFGLTVLVLGAVTLALGPAWATPMMGFVFGLGHMGLGIALLLAEKRQGAIRLHRTVA
jgi:hypothetical protein